MKNSIANVGEVHWHNDLPYFLLGYDDNGYYFKDYQAYQDDWDAPCYVPEMEGKYNNITINGVRYDCGGRKDYMMGDIFYNGFGLEDNCDWYSHNDLLMMCGFNRKICDLLFSSLNWCYPETVIADIYDPEILDYHEVFDFVEVGKQVYWLDPNHHSSDFYEVIQIKDDGGSWSGDTIVLIANDYSESEVFLRELLPDAPSKILVK